MGCEGFGAIIQGEHDAETNAKMSAATPSGYDRNGSEVLCRHSLLLGRLSEDLEPAADPPSIRKESKEVAAKDGDFGREVVGANMGEGRK